MPPPIVHVSYRVACGETVTLGCTFTPSPPPVSVRWVFVSNGRTKTLKTDKFKYSGSTPTSPSLVLKNVTKKDIGLYKCYVQNSAGTGCSLPISLTLTAGNPNVIIPKTVYQAEVGSPIIIKCNVVSELPIGRVIWYKGTEEIIIDNQKYFGGSTNSPSLVIASCVKEADEGEYVCEAQSEEGKGRSILTKLEVSSKNPDPIIEDNETNTGEVVPHLIGQIGNFHNIQVEKNVKKVTRHRSDIKLHCEGTVVIGNNALVVEATPDTMSVKVLVPIDKDAFDINLDILKHLQNQIEERFSNSKDRVDVKLDSTQDDYFLISFDIKRAETQFEESAAWLAAQIKTALMKKSIELVDQSNTPLPVRVKDTFIQSSEEEISIVSISKGTFSGHEGGNVILECVILAPAEVTSVEWCRLLDEEEIPLAIDNKKYLSGSFMSPSLVITNVKTDDEGTYFCRVLFGSCSRKSNITFLKVSNKAGEYVERNMSEENIASESDGSKNRDRSSELERTDSGNKIPVSNTASNSSAPGAFGAVQSSRHSASSGVLPNMMPPQSQSPNAQQRPQDKIVFDKNRDRRSELERTDSGNKIPVSKTDSKSSAPGAFGAVQSSRHSASSGVLPNMMPPHTSPQLRSPNTTLRPQVKIVSDEDRDRRSELERTDSGNKIPVSNTASNSSAPGAFGAVQSPKHSASSGVLPNMMPHHTPPQSRSPNTTQRPQDKIVSDEHRQAVSSTDTPSTRYQRSIPAFGSGAEGSTINSIFQQSRRGSQINLNVTPSQTTTEAVEDTPKIRKYRNKFNSDILCAALWDVNLLIGTKSGLMLLDRSGQGKVYTLISRRRFQQMEVLEGQNILMTISGKKNNIRIYYLTWLRNKIFKTEGNDKRNGFVNVGDLEGCVHFKIVQYEKTQFLVIALEGSIEIYTWAPKPYHRFMAFKSFSDNLVHKPLLEDLTAEEGQRLKVLYGSNSGFHAIDVDTTSAFDLYIPSHAQGDSTPHTIAILPNTDGMQLLLCYDNEGVYVDSNGRVIKNVELQWGELPTSIAYISTGQLMGLGNKAIEIRAAETGHLDAVFKQKKARKLKFLFERNDMVFFSSVRSRSACQIDFMTLSKPGLAN